MDKELYTKEQIIKKLNETYGNDKVWIVSTEDYDLTTNPAGRNSKKDRASWADAVVRKLYNGKDRSEIIRQDPRRFFTGEYNFAYVKFACDNDGNIYGIVNGLSLFHKNNPSDVYFYDIHEDKFQKKEAVRRMKENKLEWYKKEILIVKNKDESDRDEACKHEKEIKKLFGLYD